MSENFNQLSVSRAIASHAAGANQKRLVNTLSSGMLLISGLLLTLPGCVTENPTATVLYCTNPCKDNHKKIGIAPIVHTERLNSPFFKKHTVVLEVQPSDYPHAGITGVIGAGLMGGAAYIFSRQTKMEIEQIPHILANAKKTAQIGQIAATAEVNLAAQQIESETAMITGQGAMYVLNSLAPATQMAIGSTVQQQIELEQVNHLLTLERLELERAETQLKIRKYGEEVKKIESGPSVDDEKSPLVTLTTALKTWENGWLWRLIEDMRPLVITGDQGSGKTSLAATICLIRSHLGAKMQWLCDHHFHGANQKAWDVLKPESVAATDTEIAKALSNIVQWWSSRIANDVKDTSQVLVDEFTHLVKCVGEPAEIFIQKLLTDTRKARCQLTLITHTLTNSSFGTGTHETRKHGTICLRRFSANGKTPLPRVSLLWGERSPNGDALENIDHTIPAWFQPSIVEAHFNGKSIKI